MIWRAGVVATALGLTSGFAGVWLGVNVLGHHDGASSSLHAIIHDELALDHEQEAVIEALEASFAMQKAGYENRVTEARRAIGRALLADREMSADVAEAAEAFHDVMGELQLATLNHILAMREVMTDDQRAEFDDRLANAFDVEG
ncbi:periplasmic heavy metal sensor [Maricaulis alexandrii]|uniref:periplasmic heavy metal sensor n=1 Tax=Maricaulis alexandrii TaxID=2570354 RepID=UPI001108A0D6|nr:periplasmic heavy metal sensor [Maricaulis alexandrii]